MNAGVVLEVTKDGLGFLEEEQSKKRFAFTFDKIRGYRGETVRELGIRVGSRVRFITAGPLVERVELAQP